MSEEDYSDDEDMSWKVRRAAAKCVAAVITHYPHLLAEVSEPLRAVAGRAATGCPSCCAAACLILQASSLFNRAPK